MSLLGWGLRALKRSLENPSQPLDPWPDPGETFGSNLASSGVRVTAAKALGFHSVYRGVDLIARTVAKLPVRAYRHSHPGRSLDRDHPAHYLLARRPNEAMTPYVFKQTITAHAVLHGNGYAYVDRDGAARPRALLVLDPGRTWPVRENYRLWFLHELLSGEVRRLQGDDVIHVHGLGYDGLAGYPLLVKMRESIGHGLAQQGYGSTFFRNNARPSMVLQTPMRLRPEARKNLRESWERLHAGLDNAHKTAILEEGLQAKEVSINARDARLIEGEQFNLIEVANFLHIPPHKLGASTNVSYKSLEEENQSFLDDCLDQWLTAWQEELDAKLLTEYQKARDSHTITFDTSRLVRGSRVERGNYFTQAIQSGWMSQDEVREEEGYNPIEGGLGRVYFRPVNLAPVGGDPDGPGGPGVAPGAVLLDVPDLRQQDDYDCGPAAVQAVCAFLGVGPAERAAYVAGLGTSPAGGTTPAAILAFLARLDTVTTSAAGLEVEDLARFFAEGHPVLCPIQEEQASGTRSGHWVVVIGTGLGQVMIHDPIEGRRMLSEEDWLARWHDTDVQGNAYLQYGIAVGLELLAGPEEPEEEEEETDPDDPGQGDDDPSPPDEADNDRARLLGALHAALADAMRRMVRRVGTHARRAAGKPGEFLGWLDTIDADHRAIVAEALKPSLDALAASRSRTYIIDAARVAQGLLDELREILLDVSGRCGAAELPLEVDRAMMCLESQAGRLVTYTRLIED